MMVIHSLRTAVLATRLDPLEPFFDSQLTTAVHRLFLFASITAAAEHEDFKEQVRRGQWPQRRRLSIGGVLAIINRIHPSR